MCGNSSSETHGSSASVLGRIERGPNRKLLMAVVAAVMCVCACDGKGSRRPGMTTGQRRELCDSRVCACAAKSCVRACRRCTRVELPHNCAGRCRSACTVPRRQIERRAYFAGHPTFVTTDVKHACIGEGFTRQEREARVVSAQVVMAIPCKMYIRVR